MRVKLSKLLSAVLAICVVFAGFTAFAAPANVVTTTNYNYATNNDGNDAIPSGATMTITTMVTGVASGTEVTYLVSKGTASDDIVYIDQATADAAGATFTFTADQGKIFAATAKYGSDDSELTGLPTFTFNHGVKYLTNAAKGVTQGSLWGTPLEGATNAYIYSGTVTGPVTAYGVKLADGTELPAMDCETIDGSFVIIVEGITQTEAAGATVLVK